VKQKVWTLATLASIPLVMTLGNSMLIPVIPVIEHRLNLTPLQASLIITVYSIVAVPFIPLAGYLSDRLSRKAIIIPSLIIAGTGGLIAGLAAIFLDHSYPIILGARVLQGIGAAGAFPLVLPLTRDLFANEAEVSHALGLIETANTFGKVLSPILGAYLAMIIWYLPFMAIPILTTASMLAILLWVNAPAKQDQTKMQMSFQQIKEVFRGAGRWLATVYASGCSIMLVLFGIQFYISELLESRYQITGLTKGLVLAIPLAGLCLASYLTGHWLGDNKKQMKSAAVIGMMSLVITCTISSFLFHLVILIALLTIGFSGIGIALPSLDALITESIDKDKNGTVTSIYSSMRFVGVASGPPLFAFLMHYSHHVIFWAAAVIGMITVVLIWRFIQIDN